MSCVDPTEMASSSTGSRSAGVLRWFDEQGGSNVGDEMVVQSEAHSYTQKHEEMAADFGDLLRCVEALKDSHHAEMFHMKQKYKALKGRVLRVEMEASSNFKRASSSEDSGRSSCDDSQGGRGRKRSEKRSRKHQ
ncbi:hypothetical protein ACLOJK_011462 [Asimina triloba]